VWQDGGLIWVIFICIKP